MIYDVILNKVEAVGRQIIAGITSYAVTYWLGEPLFWLMGLRGKGEEINLSRIRRVLVVRLDDIGDMVLTTPFLRELRRNIPKSWITLVVKPRVYNLVETCPYVNEVLSCDLRIARKFGKLIIHLKAINQLLFQCTDIPAK